MSFAMFKTWMKTSNVVKTPSRPFCCWDVEAIVGTRGGREESGWAVILPRGDDAVKRA